MQDKTKKILKIKIKIIIKIFLIRKHIQILLLKMI